MALTIRSLSVMDSEPVQHLLQAARERGACAYKFKVDNFAVTDSQFLILAILEGLVKEDVPLCKLLMEASRSQPQLNSPTLADWLRHDFTFCEDCVSNAQRQLQKLIRKGDLSVPGYVYAVIMLLGNKASLFFYNRLSNVASLSSRDIDSAYSSSEPEDGLTNLKYLFEELSSDNEEDCFKKNQFSATIEDNTQEVETSPIIEGEGCNKPSSKEQTFQDVTDLKGINGALENNLEHEEYLTDKDEGEDLLRAIRFEDPLAVEACIQAGVNVNVKSKTGDTPLHLAAYMGDEKMIRTLLNAGASVKMENDEGFTALHLASTGYAVYAIVCFGADIDQKGSSNMTPLHLAVNERNLEVVETLIIMGASTKKQNGNGDTALHIAARTDDKEILKKLLEANSSLEVRNNSGDTPLHIAARTENVDMVKEMILAGKGCSKPPSKEQTFQDVADFKGINGALENNLELEEYLTDKDEGEDLLRAIRFEDPLAVEACIQAGVNVNVKSKTGDTPLHLAAYMGHEKMIRTLLNAGASVKMENDEGFTALHLASTGYAVYAIVCFGADIDQKGSSNMTPLHLAVNERNLEVVETLIIMGASTKKQNGNGDTALHIAARTDDKEILKKLLEADSSLEVRNNSGDTPLHIAARTENVDMVKEMILAGKGCSKPPSKEQTFQDVADFKGINGALENNLELEEYLTDKDEGEDLLRAIRFEDPLAVKACIQAGVNVNVKSKTGDTPLHLAAYMGDEKMIRTLLNAGASVKMENDEGFTALHLASTGYAVYAIVCFGADIDQKGSSNMTPLHLAVNERNLEVVETLIIMGASTKKQNGNGDTALHIAARTDDKEILKKLLEADSSLEVRNNSGDTPLHIAARTENVDMVKEMILAGKGCSKPPSKEQTFQDVADFKGINGALENNLELEEYLTDKDEGEDLLRAIRFEDPLAVEACIQAGVNVNVKSKTGDTPLHLAAYMGHEKMIRTLLNAGASVKMENDEGFTALHLASTGYAVYAIVCFGADIDQKGSSDMTPLHLAVNEGNLEVVETLIIMGASTKKQNGNGDTALHIAARTDDKEILKKLLVADSSLEVRNNSGDTPLHIAARTENVDMVKEMILAGKGCSKPPSKEQTFQDVADFKGINGALENNLELEEYLTDKDEGEDLLWAIRFEDPLAVEACIQARVNVNVKSKTGDTPLHLAAYMGDEKMIRTLLNAGASVKMENDEGFTALHLASTGYAVYAIVCFGADIDQKGSSNMTPLHLAVNERNLEVVETLIIMGASTKKQNGNGDTALHIAARTDDKEILKKLLEADSSLEVRNNSGDTPLHIAARTENVDMVKEMILAGKGCSKPPSKEQTFQDVADFKGINGALENNLELEEYLTDKDEGEDLLWAIRFEDPLAVEACIQARVNVNVKSKTGDTPLHLAAYMGDEKMIRTLLNAGASVKMENDEGFTALHLASTGYAVYAIVCFGADIDQKGSSNMTPLHLAVNERNLEVVETLIIMGASTKKQNGNGDTALHIAARTDDKEILKKLLEADSSLEVRNNSGDTPLHIAARTENVDMVKEMILAGKGCSKPPSKEQTFQDVADFKGINGALENNLELEEYLTDKDEGEDLLRAIRFEDPLAVEACIQAGVNVNVKSKTGDTPLHLAAYMGHEKMIRTLLNAGASVKMENDEGFTALHLASTGYAVYAIVCFGADIDQKGSSNMTPLHLAVNERNLEVVETLIIMGASTKKQNGNGDTALHIAARTDDKEILKKLLEADSSLEVRNNSGDTPLHIAARTENVDMVKEMILAGKGCSKPPSKEQTFQDVADFKGINGALENNMELEEYLTDKDEGEDLLRAIRFEDPLAVEACIQAGVNVNVKSKTGDTPLHLAAYMGHEKMIRTLLNAGASVKMENDEGFTALHLASTGYAVYAIVCFGADIDQKGSSNMTPLHLAVNERNLEVVETLIIMGASTKKQNGNGDTALHIAARTDDKEILKKLLEADSSLEVRNNSGDTPLHIAARTENVDMVKEMILAGKGCSKPPSKEQTFQDVADFKGINGALENNLELEEYLTDKDEGEDLLRAIRFEDPLAVEACIQAGVNVNVKSKTGDTPLHLAAYMGHEKMIRTLLNAGASVKMENDEGFTALHLASTGYAVYAIVCFGADIDQKGSSNMTPLHLAVNERNLEVVETLIIMGASTKKQNGNGDTALHIAARTDDKEILKKLLEADSSLEVRNNSGDTALHIAARTENVDMVKELIVAGANIEAKDSQGYTVAFSAALREHLPVLLMLCNLKADLYSTDLDGSTIMHALVRAGSIEAIKWLLEKGYDVDRRDMDGRTPLHLAVELMDRRMAQVLMKNGANVNAIIDKKTRKRPLHMAVENWDVRMAMELINFGANVNMYGDKKGYRPLHTAVDVGDGLMVRKLLDRGANVYVKDFKGRRPMDLAKGNSWVQDQLRTGYIFP